MTARSTSPPAPAIWRSSWRRGRARRRGRRQRLLRADARAGAREGAPTAAALRSASSGPTRSRCPYTDDEFAAATVGFGARNFSDLEQGVREMARVVRPGGSVVDARDHHPASPAAVDLLRAVVRPRRARARHARRRRRRPTATCRARSAASRVPRSSRACCHRCGLERDPLGADRRRDHRPARGRGGAMTRRRGRRSDAGGSTRRAADGARRAAAGAS